MAQRKRRHHSSGAAAGLTGPATGSTLHSVRTVDTHPPVAHDGSSSLTVESSRQCCPLGDVGAQRSDQPSSASDLSPLRWLQVEQQATQFSHE